MSERTQQRNAVTALAQTLENPRRPLPCAYFLLALFSCAGTLALEPLHGMPAAEQKAMEALVTASLRWLSFPRTPDEYDRLAQQSCSCPSTHLADLMHRRGVQCLVAGAKWGYTTPFQYLFHLLVNTITDIYLDDPPRSQTSDRHWTQITRQRRTCWPTQLKELLPYGPEDTTRSLLAWISTGIGLNIVAIHLRFLGLFVSLTYPVTLPYILTCPALIINCILPLLNAVCDHVEGVSAARTFLSTDEVAWQTISTIADLMFPIVKYRTDEMQRRAWLTPHTSQLLVLYDRVISACALLNHKDYGVGTGTFDHFVLLGRSLLQDFPSIAKRMTQSQLPRLLSPTRHLIDRTSWYRLTCALDLATVSHQCSSVICVEPADGPPGGRYLCSGCRRVSYCSRRCQKIDWKDVSPGTPHREACALIRRVCELYMLPRRKVMLQVRPQHQPKHYTEQVGDSVTNYFLSRSQYKIAHCVAYRSEAEWRAQVKQARSTTK